jgi:hypothetical protein
MMVGDINDAGKRIQRLIDQQIDPGSAEARELIQTLDGLARTLRGLIEDLRGGKELRISLGEKDSP